MENIDFSELDKKYFVDMRENNTGYNNLIIFDREEENIGKFTHKK